MPAAFPAWADAQKKTLAAAEQQRPDIAQARALWIKRRKRFFNKALSRLVFIDETSTNTKLTKRSGWAPKGERFRAHAPFGNWQTQTFIAGLRCHGMVAPWIVNAPMNKARFETYVETQLAPELEKGDVVILDNVAFHNWCANAVPGCCTCRPTRLISTPSKWPFPSSRPCCASAPPAPSTPSATRSKTSAACSHRTVQKLLQSRWIRGQLNATRFSSVPKQRRPETQASRAGL